MPDMASEAERSVSWIDRLTSSIQSTATRLSTLLFRRTWRAARTVADKRKPTGQGKNDTIATNTQLGLKDALDLRKRYNDNGIKTNYAMNVGGKTIYPEDKEYSDICRDMNSLSSMHDNSFENRMEAKSVEQAESTLESQNNYNVQKKRMNIPQDTLKRMESTTAADIREYREFINKGEGVYSDNAEGLTRSQQIQKAKKFLDVVHQSGYERYINDQEALNQTRRARIRYAETQDARSAVMFRLSDEDERFSRCRKTAIDSFRHMNNRIDGLNIVMNHYIMDGYISRATAVSENPEMVQSRLESMTSDEYKFIIGSSQDSLSSEDREVSSAIGRINSLITSDGPESPASGRITDFESFLKEGEKSNSAVIYNSDMETGMHMIDGTLPVTANIQNEIDSIKNDSLYKAMNDDIFFNELMNTESSGRFSSDFSGSGEEMPVTSERLENLLREHVNEELGEELSGELNRYYENTMPRASSNLENSKLANRFNLSDDSEMIEDFQSIVFNLNGEAISDVDGRNFSTATNLNSVAIALLSNRGDADMVSSIYNDFLFRSKENANDASKPEKTLKEKIDQKYDKSRIDGLDPGILKTGNEKKSGISISSNPVVQLHVDKKNEKKIRRKLGNNIAISARDINDPSYFVVTLSSSRARKLAAEDLPKNSKAPIRHSIDIDGAVITRNIGTLKCNSMKLSSKKRDKESFIQSDFEGDSMSIILSGLDILENDKDFRSDSSFTLNTLLERNGDSKCHLEISSGIVRDSRKDLKNTDEKGNEKKKLPIFDSRTADNVSDRYKGYMEKLTPVAISDVRNVSCRPRTAAKNGETVEKKAFFDSRKSKARIPDNTRNLIAMLCVYDPRKKEYAPVEGEFLVVEGSDSIDVSDYASVIRETINDDSKRIALIPVQETDRVGKARMLSEINGSLYPEDSRKSLSIRETNVDDVIFLDIDDVSNSPDISTRMHNVPDKGHSKKSSNHKSMKEALKDGIDDLMADFFLGN